MEDAVEKTKSRDDKIAAVQRVLVGQQYIITEVAAELGISRFLLWNWTREYGDEARRAFPPHVRMGRWEMLDRWRRQIEELKRENELLKQSLAFLAGGSEAEKSTKPEADYCL